MAPFLSGSMPRTISSAASELRGGVSDDDDAPACECLNRRVPELSMESLLLPALALFAADFLSAPGWVPTSSLFDPACAWTCLLVLDAWTASARDTLLRKHAQHSDRPSSALTHRDSALLSITAFSLASPAVRGARPGAPLASLRVQRTQHPQPGQTKVGLLSQSEFELPSLASDFSTHGNISVVEICGENELKIEVCP